MKQSFIVLTLVIALNLTATPLFAQENEEPAVPVMPAEAANEAMAQPDEMSIYGEVKSTDPAANSLKLQYYDYDNDEEKTADIVIDKDTKMENATSLKDIKDGDWIDAVYLPKNGLNIAKSVIVEKEEEEIPPGAMPEDNKTVEQPVNMYDETE